LGNPVRLVSFEFDHRILSKPLLISFFGVEGRFKARTRLKSYGRTATYA
jgi:hypothetical protein